MAPSQFRELDRTWWYQINNRIAKARTYFMDYEYKTDFWCSMLQGVAYGIDC